MIRQDLIKRAIEQLAAGLARAMGFRAAGQDQHALESLSEARGALPLVPGMLEDLDAAAIVDALGREAAQLLAAALAEESVLHERLHRPQLAQRRRAKSQALRDELDRREHPSP